MKKLFFIPIIMSGTACVIAATLTLATFAPNTMFIEGSPSFSPDGSRVAIQARDGKNLRGNAAHIWVGDSRKGNFRRIYANPSRLVTWIGNNEIAFQDASARGAVIIKAINITSGAVRKIYERKLLSSGYSTEILNVHAISGTGKLLLMNDRKGMFIQDLRKNRKIDLKGFTYKYHRHSTGVAFSGNDRFLLVKDDADSGPQTYDLYQIREGGLFKDALIRFPELLGRGKTLMNHFRLDTAGSKFAFTIEHCSGGCKLLSYIYETGTKKLRTTGRVPGNKVLSVNWSSDLSRMVCNDFHRKITVTDI